MASDYSLKKLRQEFKEQGKFYTPEALAKMLRTYVIEELGREPFNVLDPTCGRGNLLSVFSDDVEKTGWDVDEEALKDATGFLENTLLEHADATEPLSAVYEGEYDAIVANPPFSIKWDRENNKSGLQYDAYIDGEKTKLLAPPSKADWAFMQTMLYCLSNIGVCVSLCFPGALYRGNSEEKIRRYFVKRGYIKRVITIPKNTFVDTSIQTCVVIFRKSPSPNISDGFIEFVNTEDGVTKLVSIQEVLDNSANLSPSTYAYKEPERKSIDPIALNTQANDGFISRVENELKFSRQIADLEKTQTFKNQFLLLGLKTIRTACNELIDYLE